MSDWTSAAWEAERTGSLGDWIVFNGRNGDEIAKVDGDIPEQARAIATHIVACHNALAGLNPEAVGDLVALAEAAVEMGAAHSDSERGRLVSAARAALEKVRKP